MTECGHGSNVANVETVATYDPKTSQFVINTPTQSATKFMIGNVAVYGHMVVLFARLNIGGEDKGVHPFLCPLRDTKTGKVFDTVEIGDCGLKNGWNGVDNAFIKFVDHKIPREYLLNRFADVAADGTYTNSLGSPSMVSLTHRFAATII
jgi:acyl-CoA oxidase